MKTQSFLRILSLFLAVNAINLYAENCHSSCQTVYCCENNNPNDLIDFISELKAKTDKLINNQQLSEDTLDDCNFLLYYKDQLKSSLQAYNPVLIANIQSFANYYSNKLTLAQYAFNQQGIEEMASLYPEDGYSTFEAIDVCNSDSLSDLINFISKLEVKTNKVFCAPKGFVMPYEDEAFFSEGIFGKLSFEDEKLILMWKASKVQAWHEVLRKKGILSDFSFLVSFKNVVQESSQSYDPVLIANTQSLANNYSHQLMEAKAHYQIVFNHFENLYRQLIQSVEEGTPIAEAFAIKKLLSQEASITASNDEL